MRWPLLLLSALPAAAEPRPDVEAVLDRALAEQRVILTCTALDAPSHDLMREAWADTAARTVAALQDAGYDPDAVARFRDRAAYAALTPGDDARFAEVRALCLADPEWHRRLLTFEGVLLPDAALDLLASNPGP